MAILVMLLRIRDVFVRMRGNMRYFLTEAVVRRCFAK